VAVVAALAPAKTYTERETMREEIPTDPTLHPNTLDFNEVADHLRLEGFLSSVLYCLDNQLNGRMLLAIE
jgi:hypothetical protein